MSAEISKIDANGLIFSIKDETARQQIESERLARSGSAISSARYNLGANKIEFLNAQNQVVSEINAASFTKDGMVQDVRLIGSNLVIYFNTDANKSPIYVSLASIFNPNNYYDKDDIDEIAASKQDTIDDLQEIREGASKGASAYQKPPDGIPVSDIDGIVLANAQDFVNPTEEERSKVATVGSILDNTEDEPRPNSEKFLKSGSVFLSDAKVPHLASALNETLENKAIEWERARMWRDDNGVAQKSNANDAEVAGIISVNAGCLYNLKASAYHEQTLIFYVDSEYNIISSFKAKEYDERVNFDTTAPQGAVYMLLNVKYGYSRTVSQYVYANVLTIKENIESAIDALNARQEDTEEVIEKMNQDHEDENGNVVYNEWLNKMRYYTGTSVGSLADLTPAVNSAINCIKDPIPCQAGDVFTMNVHGHNNGNLRAWMFLDENYNVLSKCGTSDEARFLFDSTIVAPPNAAWLVVNNYNAYENAYVIKGKSHKVVAKELDSVISDVEMLKNGAMQELPSYYTDIQENEIKSYITKKLDAISYIQEHMSSNSDSFFFVTDYHYHKNAGYTPTLVKYIRERTGIDKLLFGGDIGTYSTDPYKETHRANTAWSELESSANEMYSVIGNHEWSHDIDRDVSDSIQSGAYSENGVKNFYAARYKRTATYMDSSTMCYYVDNTVNRIRYYFIHGNGSGHPMSGSNVWLGDSLKTVPDGYGVIVVVHHAYIPMHAFYYQCNRWIDTTGSGGERQMNQLLQAFNNHSSVSLFGNIYDYSDTNGYVIGLFSGHRHHSCLYKKNGQYIKIQNNGTESVPVVVPVLDDNNQIQYEDNAFDINIFQGSEDSLVQVSDDGVTVNPWYWEGFSVDVDENQQVVVNGEKVYREEDTTNEQCFYVVQVDLDAKKCHITAIGGDMDYEFEFDGTSYSGDIGIVSKSEFNKMFE